MGEIEKDRKVEKRRDKDKIKSRHKRRKKERGGKKAVIETQREGLKKGRVKEEGESK